MTLPPIAERRLFLVLALAMLLAVIVGFAPSFFLRPLLGAPPGFQPITPLVMAHGLVFTGWIALFTAQVALMGAGRPDLHRRLGWLGVVLVPAMLVTGVLAALGGVARASGPPGVDPHVFLAVPLFSVLGFVPLFSLALWRHRDPQTHKRLMMAGMCTMMSAAFGRIELFAGLLGLVLLPLLPMLVLLAWDLRKRGRPHRATLAGGLMAAIAIVGPLIVGPTRAWGAIAHWLVP